MASSTFAQDQVAELLDAWRCGRVPSRVALDWMGQGLRGSVQDKGRLDELLGLAGPGVESLSTIARRLKRDEHLALAALCMSADENPDCWECCKRLASKVREFEAGAWTQSSVKGLIDPPESWEAWRRHLFRAFQLGLVVPATPQGLRDRVKSIPPFSLHEEAARVIASFI